MTNIPNAYKKVPMMFQAQTAGRCQLQRLDPDRRETHDRDRQPQDAEIWCEEWISETSSSPPQFSESVKTREYIISWRFVTNSGQDDGVIRPVIGALGYPFYPGSSMKGAFRQACRKMNEFSDRVGRYCGQELSGGDFTPGILRFHGGYPTDDSWADGLVDLVHPQQPRQVMDSSQTSAFIQISLYQSEIQFGISTSEDLEESEWNEIWRIWEVALSYGIGCRVSAGYGHQDQLKGDLLYQPHVLKGQGMASKRLDGSGEFRANIFRAAIRGHALRIFGGLTDARTAEREVEKLFGGVSGHGTWGLLMMNFVTTNLEEELFGSGRWEVPSYKVEGQLGWLLAQKISNEQRTALKDLILHLNQFAMIFGGFGKSWRRANHRLFYEEYYEENNNRKPLIGCHWQWTKRYARDVKVYTLKHITSFLTKLQDVAKVWLQLQGVEIGATYANGWREAWHPDKVKVWGRIARNKEDSEAIQWLHQPYQTRDNQAQIPELSIYKSSITGKMGQIGRLWHRMYPLMRLDPDPNDSTKKIPKPTASYIELLTIFPTDSKECSDFLNFLANDSQFSQLWGTPWRTK